MVRALPVGTVEYARAGVAPRLLMPVDAHESAMEMSNRPGKSGKRRVTPSQAGTHFDGGSYFSEKRLKSNQIRGGGDTEAEKGKKKQ